MTVQLKGNFYVGPVKFSPNFDMTMVLMYLI